MRFRFQHVIVVAIALVSLSLLWGLRTEKTSHGTDSRGLGMLIDSHRSYGVFGYCSRGIQGGEPVRLQIDYVGLAITIVVSAFILGWCTFMLLLRRRSGRGQAAQG
jgi:hypothetical protein